MKTDGVCCWQEKTAMAKCDVCGNEYHLSFEVITARAGLA